MKNLVLYGICITNGLIIETSENNSKSETNQSTLCGWIAIQSLMWFCQAYYISPHFLLVKVGMMVGFYFFLFWYPFVYDHVHVHFHTSVLIRVSKQSYLGAFCKKTAVSIGFSHFNAQVPNVRISSTNITLFFYLLVLLMLVVVAITATALTCLLLFTSSSVNMPLPIRFDGREGCMGSRIYLAFICFHVFQYMCMCSSLYDMISYHILYAYLIPTSCPFRKRESERSGKRKFDTHRSYTHILCKHTLILWTFDRIYDHVRYWYTD